jgi:N-acetylglucosaminyl-diphospho-decaprenol L-rhamnosyltransferase
VVVGATGERPGVVVVDHDAGALLVDCVRSLVAEAPSELVVVENGDPAGARRALAGAGLEVAVVAPGRNLGYGAGANRGVAALGRGAHVFVCNGDLTVVPGCLEVLAAALDGEPAWALAGPLLRTAAGEPYPSARRFPSPGEAAGHALVGLVKPDNRFSRRYRPAVSADEPPRSVDWVSGAAVMIRRQAFEELGGFDETYFMFAEDLDLCWRAAQAGWGVGFVPTAAVTHLQGVSTRRHPYRMLLAHHASALRFAERSTSGWRRVALPGAAAVLGLRLAAATLRQWARPPG